MDVDTERPPLEFRSSARYAAFTYSNAKFRWRLKEWVNEGVGNKKLIATVTAYDPNQPLGYSGRASAFKSP